MFHIMPLSWIQTCPHISLPPPPLQQNLQSLHLGHHLKFSMSIVDVLDLMMPLIVPPASTSLANPSPTSDLDLPIALCKGTHTCTHHPISASIS